MADDPNSASIAADIAAAIETVEAPAAAPTPAAIPAPASNETPAEGVPAAAPQPAGGERQRGPDGKFLPKDAAPTTAAAPKEPKAPAEPKPADPAAAAAGTETKPAAGAAPADPPAIARWSAADKEMFRKAPKDQQDFLLRRHGELEADHTKKTMEIAEFRRTFEPVAQMFAPFKPQMQAQGWTEATLIKAWGDVERELMDGRGIGVIQRMVQQYRLDPAQVAAAITGRPVGTATAPGAAAAPGAPEMPQLAPEVQAALDRLMDARYAKLSEPLAKQLQTLAADHDARQRQIATEQQTTALNTVQRFIDEKDASGNLAHPYYPEVSQMMIQLARLERSQGRVPDLKAIYDQAVWATPSVREKLLAAQAAQAEEKRRTEARAEATRAAKAGSSVQGAPVAGQPPERARSSGPKSLRETLLDAADQHSDAA
jgi:hypothetical protein